MHELQSAAVSRRSSPAAHWGPDARQYSSWTSHTNRLLPVYTFGTLGAGPGVDLTSYTGANSVYRSDDRLLRLYHGPVEECVCPEAEYLDQTNIFDLQYAALQAGKKYIFLVVFDGLDWETTRAASIWNLQRVAYAEGRGSGTHFQDYDAGGTSQYGWMVTSPYRDGTQVDVNSQRVKNPHRGLPGGYCSRLGGLTPWSSPTEPRYLVAGPDRAELRHAYTDSASSATSMTTGIKTYNDAINVDGYGDQQATIAHHAQRAGRRVGVVTSVPISHATPAAAYAHNVHRDDYQDLSRDLLGLPSVSHPDQPLPGLDVVIGSGYGVENA
jgi:alkaline phosphatase